MSEQELRSLVREVLREALRKTGQNATNRQFAPAPAERVQLSSDADLAGFVRRIVALLDDPASAAIVRSGTMRFTLSSAKPVAQSLPASAASNGAGSGAELSGTVTEARVNKAADAGRIVLAPDAVITPLARDRARALGLKIERRH